MGRVKVDRSKAEVLIRRRAVENLDAQAERLLGYCQEEVPVKTGFLRASHRIVRVNFHTRRIVATAPYAREVYDGRGPQGSRRPNRWFQRAIDRASAQ